jgi:hypothetical protein
MQLSSGLCISAPVWAERRSMIPDDGALTRVLLGGAERQPSSPASPA